MDSFPIALIDMQVALVSALIPLTTIGVVILGLGMMIAPGAPILGHRVRRLGLRTVGACLAVIVMHGVLVNIYGHNIPPALIIGIYAVAGLLLLQGLLSLTFGPRVASSVIASLVGALITALVVLAFPPLRPFAALLANIL